MKLTSYVLLLTAAAFAGCSKPSAEEYFARAQKDAQAAASIADTLRSPDALRAAFQPALDGFGNVIRVYPRHPLAEAALFEIANIRNSNLHMPQEAIDGYALYCRQYPSGQKTALAMFLIGYLYNNELHNTDSAAVAYRRFLEKYPDSDMAASAKFELNTLGKNPDEALPLPKEEHPAKRKAQQKTAT